MLMNHHTRHSLLRDWTLHLIIEDWRTNTKDRSNGPDDQHFRLPYLYIHCPIINNLYIGSIKFPNYM